MSQNIIFRSIVLAFALLGSPAFAQSNPSPAAAPPVSNHAAAANANALTPDQAKRALDTLQDDTKRAQMIETLRAIAGATPAIASTTPAIASTTPAIASTTPAIASTTPAIAGATPAAANAAAPMAVATPTPAATPPAPEAAPIPLSADSLGAQLLLTVSEQVGDMSQRGRRARADADAFSGVLLLVRAHRQRSCRLPTCCSTSPGSWRWCSAARSPPNGWCSA